MYRKCTPHDIVYSASPGSQYAGSTWHNSHIASSKSGLTSAAIVPKSGIHDISWSKRICWCVRRRGGWNGGGGYVPEISFISKFLIFSPNSQFLSGSTSSELVRTSDLCRKRGNWDLPTYRCHSFRSTWAIYSMLSLIHIWRCRRIERCRSRWSPYH